MTWHTATRFIIAISPEADLSIGIVAASGEVGMRSDQALTQGSVMTWVAVCPGSLRALDPSKVTLEPLNLC